MKKTIIKTLIGLALVAGVITSAKAQSPGTSGTSPKIFDLTTNDAAASLKVLVANSLNQQLAMNLQAYNRITAIQSTPAYLAISDTNFTIRVEACRQALKTAINAVVPNTIP